MKRPQCSLNCRRGCGHDHSSKEPQSPSLVDIEVVRKIIAQSFINTFQRQSQLVALDIGQEEFDGKKQAVIQWLTETFGGANLHFESGPEGWNPSGLCEHIRDTFLGSKDISPELLDKGDEELLTKIFEIFMDQVCSFSEEFLRHGIELTKGQQLPDVATEFIESWSMLLVGAPTEFN